MTTRKELAAIRRRRQKIKNIVSVIGGLFVVVHNFAFRKFTFTSFRPSADRQNNGRFQADRHPW